MEKVKLMCSYGGKIQPRAHDRQLSYVGGDTKILTVDRNVNFPSLLSKLHNLCESNSEIRFKYQLPGQDLDALISIFDDDDVEHMMFEYDILRRISSKPARLRLFIFSPSPTPVTARSPNPDFLFGFDKDYSFNHPHSDPELRRNTTTDTVVSPTGNAYAGPGFVDGAPKSVHGIATQLPADLSRGNYAYPTPLVYRVPMVAGGHFQAGQYRAVVANNVNNREQPVYTFVPVMPSPQEPNIPSGGFVSGQGGSPVGYDVTKPESLHPTIASQATSATEFVSQRAPHDA